jgi:hypothetical protein
VDEEDAARLDIVAKGIEARLQALHSAAPEDQTAEDLQAEALKWDEQELFEEGMRAGGAEEKVCPLTKAATQM